MVDDNDTTLSSIIILHPLLNLIKITKISLILVAIT